MNFGMTLSIASIICFVIFLIWLIVRIVRWDSKWPAILCMAVCVVLFFIGVTIYEPDNDDTNIPGQTSPQGNEEQQPKDQNRSDGGVGFDGIIEGDYFNISIVDAKWTDSLETPLYTITPEKEGTKLLFLTFSAKNVTGETYNLGMFNSYVDKQATLPTVAAGEIDGAMPFVGAVASGMEIKAYWILEIPEDWKELQLNYFESTGSECKQYFTIHREDIG